MPHRNRPLTRFERTLYRLFPPAQRAMRGGIYWARETFLVQFRHRSLGKRVEKLALRHMHSAIEDPELRAKLTPRFAIGCKRILPSNEWYPALARPNVEVVTDGIAEVREHSIVERRRHRARGRHDHLRHRLPRHRHPDRRPRARRRRREPRRDLGRQRGGLQGHDGGRLPEPVPARGTEHRPRPHLDRVHDRVAAHVRARRAGGDAPPRGAHARGAAGGAGRLQRRGAGEDQGHRLGRPAAARAGTSTATAATRRSGRPSPGPSASSCARSTRAPTRSAPRANSASASRPSASTSTFSSSGSPRSRRRISDPAE